MDSILCNYNISCYWLTLF